MTTFKEMMQEEFEKEVLEDIANHGCSTGIAFVYYADNDKVYDEYENDIWEALHEDAEDMGYKNELELIGSFNGAKDVESDQQFRNLLVWYMAERTARELTDN